MKQFTFVVLLPCCDRMTHGNQLAPVFIFLICASTISLLFMPTVQDCFEDQSTHPLSFVSDLYPWTITDGQRTTNLWGSRMGNHSDGPLPWLGSYCHIRQCQLPSNSPDSRCASAYWPGKENNWSAKARTMTTSDLWWCCSKLHHYHSYTVFDESKYLHGTLDKSCDAYLDELQLGLEETCRILVSLSTIWRALKRSGYTMKKVCFV